MKRADSVITGGTNFLSLSENVAQESSQFHTHAFVDESIGWVYLSKCCLLHEGAASNNVIQVVGTVLPSSSESNELWLF
jgi:hypothetical protein